jgi:hypothetical protein
MSLPDLHSDPTLAIVGWRYQLIKPCPAVSTFGKLHENVIRTLVIPKDELITVVDGPFNGARLVDITWELKPYMIFTEHLRNCGRRLGITSS